MRSARRQTRLAEQTLAEQRRTNRLTRHGVVVAVIGLLVGAAGIVLAQTSEEPKPPVLTMRVESRLPFPEEILYNIPDPETGFSWYGDTALSRSSDVPASPPLCDDWGPWKADSAQLADLGNTRRRLIVQNNSSSAAVLDVVTVKVLDRSGPDVEGTALVCPEGFDAGPAAIPRLLFTDLNEPQPQVWYQERDSYELPTRRLGLTVAPGETEELWFAAITTQGTVRWNASIEFVIAGRRTMRRIGEFTTHAVSGSNPLQFWYDLAWHDAPPEGLSLKDFDATGLSRLGTWICDYCGP